MKIDMVCPECGHTMVFERRFERGWLFRCMNPDYYHLIEVLE